MPSSAAPPPPAKILDTLCSDVQQSFLHDRTILSFKEYFQAVVELPARHLRCAPQYLVDMLHHFGHDTVQRPYGKLTRFRLFDAPLADFDKQVAGQEAVQEALYRALANFAREGRVNKLLLLHGPNGSAKSSLCRTLMSGMEVYARLPAGAVYSFNWIFPSGSISSNERIGFGSPLRTAAAGDSYAYAPAESIDARIPCEMHDHPLFLIPAPSRRLLLEQLLPTPDAAPAASAELLPPRAVISEYLRTGDLCHKCRRIYDALLINYEGDVQRVLNHIQVERFYPSRRYRRGISTIEPQLSVDARMQQVTADRSLAALPKALQHLSLYEPTGPLVDANRGLLEYSDLLKRPVDAFKYLLATVETATVSMDAFLLHVDMVLLASTNETYLDAFKEHPDFASFKGRMELIQVPYLRRYSDERAIYLPQIKARVVGRHVAPHAVDVAALWGVLTRLRRADATLYAPEIRSVIASLTPLEKLHLYNSGEIPERLTTREAKELHHRIAELYHESSNAVHYEGRFGASARELRTTLLNAAHHPDYACLHPLAVLEGITELLNAKSVYDFLRQDVVGAYQDHAAFLQQTETLYVQWIDEEMRHAMALTGEESYTELFERYVLHVSHWVKGERLLDSKTGQYQHADEQLMRQIEAVLLSPGESKEDFRRAMIGTIGARALEVADAEAEAARQGTPHPSTSQPNYNLIFKSYIHRLREDFFKTRGKILHRRLENFLSVAAGEPGMLDPKDIAQAQDMMQHLTQHNGYCPQCARDTAAYLLKKRYEASL